MTLTSIDVAGLRDKLKALYQAVADELRGTCNFEMDYDLAVRRGYPTSERDQIPPGDRVVRHVCSTRAPVSPMVR